MNGSSREGWRGGRRADAPGELRLFEFRRSGENASGRAALLGYYAIIETRGTAAIFGVANPPRVLRSAERCA